MNKHAKYYENLDLFGCFGDQGSLEVAIGDHDSLEIAHIFLFVSIYYLIASSGIKARLIVFYNNLRSTSSPCLFGMKKNERG